MSDFSYSYEVTRRVVGYRRTAERHLTACQQTEADAAQRAETPEDTFGALVRASRERKAQS